MKNLGEKFFNSSRATNLWTKTVHSPVFCSKVFQSGTPYEPGSFPLVLNALGVEGFMSELNEIKSLTPLPPPPPPQPPPHVPAQPLKLNPKALNASKSSQLDENELDLSLKIILSSETDFNKVFYTSNVHIEPQLQDGPKCGLVALSMATSALENYVSVDDIFQAAVSLNFSKQGEMFSAEFLALLAERFGFKTTILKGGLHAHLCCVLKTLLRKHLLLVPYDADFNHSPCCRKGVKAHWAVITGVVILEEGDERGGGSVVLRSSACECTDSGADADLPVGVSVDGGEIAITRRPSTSVGRQSRSRGGKVYLIGRQGKSRHLGLWAFDDMAESNDNLVSVSTSRTADSYLLPEGGITEGLKGKAVVLEHPAVTTTTGAS